MAYLFCCLIFKASYVAKVLNSLRRYVDSTRKCNTNPKKSRAKLMYNETMNDDSTFYISHDRHEEEVQEPEDQELKLERNENGEVIKENTEDFSEKTIEESKTDEEPEVIEPPKSTVTEVPETPKEEPAPSPKKSEEELKKDAKYDKKVVDKMNESSALDELLKGKLASYPLPDQNTSTMNPLAPPIE